MARGDTAILTPPTVTIDTTTAPEDLPDRADGNWSKQHLMRFLARQPKTMRIIPLDNYELEMGPDRQHFKEIGYMGHFFHIRKGVPETVPIQIAEIIDNMLDPFPTQQSRLRKREITDVRSLPQDPQGRGLLGVEVQVGR